MACNCSASKMNQLAWENQTLRADLDRARQVLQLAREASNRDLEAKRAVEAALARLQEEITRLERRVDALEEEANP